MSGPRSSSQMGENEVRNSTNLKHFADTDEIWSVNKISNEVVTWLAENLENLKNRLYTDDEELDTSDDVYESFDTVLRDLEHVRNTMEQLNKFEILVNEQIRAFLRPNLPDIQRVEEVAEQSESQRLSVHTQSILISHIKKLVPAMSAAVSELKAKLKLAPQNEAGEAAATGAPLESEQQEKDDAGPHIIPTRSPEQIQRTSMFKYFEEQYRNLGNKMKKCLSCILVFPDDFVIRKTTLRYWWMAEGLIDTTRAAEGKKIAEFDKFIEMGFIEPVMEERRTLENKFIRMNPFIRLILVTIAKREHFDFDSEGVTGKVLLLSTNQKSSQNAISNKDPTNLEILFNVSQPLIDLQSFWLSKARSLRVLQLGSWEGPSNNNIEVASTEFLKSFVNLKSLRYLGLNMVSGIHKLPPSVSSLGDLRVLDLKACHNLTKIPAEIRKLTRLTHLDMSSCYMMESMPKELGHLNELLVLKGFVVGDPEREDACKIDDLTKLKKLRKLGLYCSMEADEVEATELEGLSKFEALRSLTIAWIQVPRPSSSKKIGEVDSTSKSSRGKSHRGNCLARLVSRFHEIGAKEKKGYPVKTRIRRANSAPVPEKSHPIKPEKAKSFEQVTETPPPADKSILPKGLEKLDLQCYPNSRLPIWINPGSLVKLEKLYIRGGHLCRLEEEFKTVKTLRLRYLTKLKMDWKKLTTLFPDLQFLEKIGCPRLSLFPCNGYGEWKRNT